MAFEEAKIYHYPRITKYATLGLGFLLTSTLVHVLGMNYFVIILGVKSLGLGFLTTYVESHVYI